MSVEVMRAEDPISQRPKHYLESFFYVLLYVCMKYKAPSTKRVQEDLKQYKSFPVDDWFPYDRSFKQIADAKVAQMSRFEKSFIEKFDPYFDDLKDCLRSLRNIIFANGYWDNTAEHHTVLEILRDTYDSLDDEGSTYTSPPSRMSSSQGAPSDKRWVSNSAKRPSYSAGAKIPKSGSSGLGKRQASGSAANSKIESSTDSRSSKKRRSRF